MIAILYTAALAVIVVYGLNLLWLAAGFIWHDRTDDEDLPESKSDLQRPAVTIQLPIFNERYVAGRLIDACARLDYPGDRLEIQVLDDSTDDTVTIVDKRVRLWRDRGVGIVHLRRDNRSGFKAGALQEGLRIATGEFVAIFDADFVPRRDFLNKTLPHFQDPAVGMVQIRWSYLNRDWSLLTRLQALSLDAHFAVEQFVRNRVGCFINFNGTAGVWRRSCIEDAGGWQTDTLTEDLDLSYRAQLKGWRFVFLRRPDAPSELPIGMNDVRAQQFRWTKGAIQTARKTVRDLVRLGPDSRTIVEGLIHLTSHLIFPFVLMAALLHAPLVYANATTGIPSLWYQVISALGLLAFLGFFLVQLLAQRSLHADWLKRITLVPIFLAGSMGLAINNTIAIADALTGRASTFRRTPKVSNAIGGRRPLWWNNSYAVRRLPRVVFLEAAMAAYCAIGLAVVINLGAWSAVPFQALLTFGFGLVSVYNLVQFAEAN